MSTVWGRVSRVLQLTPFGFDASVWEFFWPLTQGAVLVLARPGGHRDPGYLAEVIVRERITRDALRAVHAAGVPGATGGAVRAGLRAVLLQR